MPGHSSRCYGCGKTFHPSEGREAEVLCEQCRTVEPMEMDDALGLPREYEPPREGKVTRRRRMQGRVGSL